MRITAALALLCLAGCGGVKVAPDANLPKALVQPLAARVGLVLDDELRSFHHEETRASANWSVDLGPAVRRATIAKDVFLYCRGPMPGVLGAVDVWTGEELWEVPDTIAARAESRSRRSRSRP